MRGFTHHPAKKADSRFLHRANLDHHAGASCLLFCPAQHSFVPVPAGKTAACFKLPRSKASARTPFTAVFHDVKRPARQSWHLISWFAAGDNDGAPALTVPGFYKTGKTCWATRYHCCAGRGPAWRWLHERWLQRVNATQIAAGVAVTTANVRARRCSAEPSTYDHRDNALGMRERMHALNRGGAIN